MVDINLIGDDKEQPENDDFNENYSEDFSADTGDFSSETDFSDSDLDHGIYDRSYTQNSNKRTTYIIVGVVAVLTAIIAIYWFMNSSKKKGSVTEDVKIESTKPEDIVDTETPAENVTIPEQPPVTLPPYIREVVSSTQRGIKAVETILTSVPANVNFTMIQYRDGNFLTELLGQSASNITQMNNQLQQRFPSGNVKLLSRDKKDIQGYSYEQALLNGKISNVNDANIRMPNFLTAEQVKSQFSEYCNQLGMSLKQFEIKSETVTDGFRRIPVMFIAVGGRDAALNFLNTILENNLNVNISKIVFVATDRKFTNNKIRLILNMEIYNQI